MLKTYNTIDKDELQIGDTVLLSMTRGNNGKIMIEVGERVINNTRAIVVMNQSDSRHTPGIRRAKFPAEPYDILVGLGIDVEQLNWELNDDFEDYVELNYLNPTYKNIRMRVEVRETTTPTRLEHVLDPKKYAKRKGKNGPYIKSKGDYVFSITECILTNSEPNHTFIKSDFSAFVEEYGKEINSPMLNKLRNAPKHMSWDDLKKLLE
tara:strand:- start:451 stop:1074 length:624 start_codon:yes stop_codon:yes gene_type:complete